MITSWCGTDLLIVPCFTFLYFNLTHRSWLQETIQFWYTCLLVYMPPKCFSENFSSQKFSAVSTLIFSFLKKCFLYVLHMGCLIIFLTCQIAIHSSELTFNIFKGYFFTLTRTSVIKLHLTFSSNLIRLCRSENLFYLLDFHWEQWLFWPCVPKDRFYCKCLMGNVCH